MSLPSYIKDTGDFLTKIYDVAWDEGILLITIDVTALYTFIEHEDGLRAVKHFLNTRALGLYKYTEMLLIMIQNCLQDYCFLFNNCLYQQMRGTAMGTCYVPSYANLHMGWWEEQVLLGEELIEWSNRIIMWVCYTDYIFAIWKGDEETATEFVKKINTNTSNHKP